MPSEKSARAAERKRQSNAPLRSRAKTEIRKVRRLVAADDLDAAQEAVKQAVVALDKAAQKGAIHPNNASRRKARIMQLVNKAAKGEA